MDTGNRIVKTWGGGKGWEEKSKGGGGREISIILTKYI